MALSTAESEYISITKGAAHALEVGGAVVEYGLTLKVVCETDASPGRAMATRRGVGRVRHLDARLLWLQQLCAEGAVEVRASPGEHSDADLGTKVVGLRRMTSILKGTPLRPPMGWSSWMVATTLRAPGTEEIAYDMVWIDEWRGDRGRSRLCVRQFRAEGLRDDLLAGTPDTFFIKYLLAKAASCKDFGILVIDISVAFMHARTDEEIYVKVPTGIQSSNQGRSEWNEESIKALARVHI